MYETTLHGNEFASFLQGRPGLIPSVPRVWGCTAFPLTGEIWGIPLTSYTLKKTPSKECQNPYKAFHLQVKNKLFLLGMPKYL